MADNQITINNLSKVYENGFNALKNINLNIKKGEIFAMLGPNGAGKTTLISIICGIVNPTSGKVFVDNYDIINDFRETRSKIGLVPIRLLRAPATVGLSRTLLIGWLTGNEFDKSFPGLQLGMSLLTYLSFAPMLTGNKSRNSLFNDSSIKPSKRRHPLAANSAI